MRCDPMIDWGGLARAIHILSIVVWIGGVSLVTTALLPSMKRKPPQQWVRDFNEVERRFASQAKIAVLLVLLSGLYMLYAYDLWDRLADARFWWMHLMVGVWLIFALLLFVVEPLTIRPALGERRLAPPQPSLRRILWMHRLLLALSLTAIFAAVGGAHGLF
jgi:uncharacterized membrane protein